MIDREDIAPEPETSPPEAGPAAESREGPGVMIPQRAGRPKVEAFFMRIIATAGIIGIGVAIAAIMVSQKSHGWIVGLVVSLVTVVLAAVLWSSRRL